MKPDTRISAAERIFIAAAAFISILICSKSSPLYPFNDWVDANCFLTVGRSMLHGLIPYRDLFEQKGPLLYMLHALAALISERSFLGVYIIETAACTWLLTAAYRILRIDCGKWTLCVLPLISAVIYSSDAFCHGDSAEELCLPFLLTSLYIGLRSIREERPLSTRESTTIGALSGCILWIKFSLLGFYAGFFVIPAITAWKKGGLRRLMSTIREILLGVAAVSAPILLYFALNGALGDLFEVYFYDNLFLYRPETGILSNLNHGLEVTFGAMLLPAIIIVLAVPALAVRREWHELAYYTLSLLTAFMLAFSGGRAYFYYPMVLSFFVPYAVSVMFAPADKSVNNVIRRVPKCSVPFILALSAAAGGAVCALTCRNTYLMHYKKEDIPQYRFAKVINEVPDATLLNYGFLDGGFYTASGTIPTCRFFCRINLPYSEMDEKQRYIVKNRLVDFIVMRSENTESPRTPDGYELAAEADMPYYDRSFTYRLYRRRD